MAINKKLIHFKTFENFNSKKLSANETNTEYTLGVNGEVQTGSPDILYQSICWIKDTKQQWTHGQLYDFGGSTEATTLAYAEYTGTNTAVAVATIDGYFPTTLVEGAAVAVKIEGNLTLIKTLNVNGTGAKNVYYKGNSLVSGSISRYNTYLFIFDGSYYRIIGVDTDTHYTAKNVITSSSTSTSNATAANGNVCLNVVENSAVRSSHKIIGTGGTTVTSDASGNVAIDTPLKTINGESIVGSGDLTITENIQSDWFGTDVQDGAIKNRTHYITGTKITGPGTYPMIGTRIYFNGQIINLVEGESNQICSGPPVKVTLNSNELTVEDISGYLTNYPIVIISSIFKLDDAFISDNIVRNSELEDYVTKETFEYDLNNKQEILESGFNIKTINGEDILNLDTSNIFIVQNNNEIWYTTTDGDECDINFDNFREDFQYSETPKDTTIMVFDSDVTLIGDYAFDSCSSLKSITIPNSVNAIGVGAFTSCSSLKSITIPNSVTWIGYEAFNECSSLTSITIPNSVTSIENDTFYGCLSLTSIIIPDGVTEIGDGAFNGCSSLTTITIPNSVEFIGEDAFRSCTSLTTVTINSDNCQFNNVFSDSPNIKVINCNSNNPPIVNGNLVLPENVKIYVPIESLNAYKTADGWSNYADNICAIIDSSNIKTINGNSILGSGDITVNSTDTVTEDTVSGWGFTKNVGTITEVKANGTSISTSGVANIPAASTSSYGIVKLNSTTTSTSRIEAATSSAVKAAYDLANGKQDKLTSGTNIVTARGNSILTSGDLFNSVIITTNVAGAPQQTTVGACYVYAVPQTTSKKFVLNVPNNIWNDSINIIINTSESITFQSSNNLPILWANGTIPTFDSDKVYEISFRYTPMGWLGVAVAFYNA